MTDRAAPVLVELAAGGQRVILAPEIGGAIAQWQWHDIDVLRPAGEEALRGREVRRMACYPLVPYSNRIANACLQFEGQSHPLRQNFPPEPHSIHGVGWQRAWRVVRRTEAGAQMELAHAPDLDWPFRFEAWQACSLLPDALEVRLRLRNADEHAMPAGLGFHPFFPLDPELRLQAEWEGTWKPGKDRLPSRWISTPPECDYRLPRPVAGWSVDQCFTGWKRHARLEYPTHQVEMTASEDLGFMVCFVPGDGRAFIAIEPVSHVNNAFALAAQGQGRTGLRVLQPGESWEVTMTLAVRRGKPS